MRLPFMTARRQRLSFVQATEAGALKASVTADVGLPATAGYCWEYAPPGLVVHVSPRR
jgi:hypothetical protein